MTAPTPRRAWLVTPLIAATAYLGLYGISPMVEEGSWRATVAIALVVAVVAVMVSRRLTRSRFLPTGVGVVLSVWVLVVAFARTESDERYWLPSPGALTALGHMFPRAIHQAQVSVMPAPMTPELLILITAACLALFLLAEHIAVSWRAVAVSGVVLITPWVPAMALQYHLELGALLGSLLCWLLAVGASTVWRSTERSPSLFAVGTAAASVVAVGALVTPVFVGSPGWGSFPRFTTPNSSDVTTRLNLALDLQASLTTGAENVVMSYTSTGLYPDVWRMATLVDFNGNSWDRQAPEGEDLIPLPTGVVWPEPMTEPMLYGARAAILDVTIRSLSDVNLPMPAAPRIIDIAGDWSYAPTMDEVVGTSSIKGLHYQLYAGLGHIDVGALASMVDLPAQDLERGIGPEYTALPSAVDIERIETLAREIAVDATTRYDQALAIQTYLRDPLTFTYDTTVQPRGGDAISTFLDQRRGYCVQFASTMVVMLRTLGIPSRLGVGFLAGEANSEGRHIVTGAQAHTWPEVFFPSVGWVRFEPTPATQTGAVPSHADPQSDEVDVPDSVRDAADAQERGEPRPVFTPRPQPTSEAPQASVPPTAPTPTTPPETPLALIVGAVVMALLLAGGAVWWIRRWRRSGELDPERAWAQLRSRLDSRWRWPATLTPLEVPSWLAQQWETTGLVVNPDTHRHVTFLATLVSNSRYAERHDALSTEGLADLVSHIVADVKASQRATTITTEQRVSQRRNA